MSEKVNKIRRAVSIAAVLLLTSVSAAQTAPTLGDVDCDGDLTAVDAAVVLGLFVGNIVDGDLSPPCSNQTYRLSISDWDLNGSINPIDASVTLAILAGTIDECDTPLGQSIPGMCQKPKKKTHLRSGCRRGGRR